MSPLIFHRLGQNLALATVNNFKKKPNKDVVTFNEVLNCLIQKKKLLVIHGVAAASSKENGERQSKKYRFKNIRPCSINVCRCDAKSW